MADGIRAEASGGGKTSGGPAGLIERALQPGGESVNNVNMGSGQGDSSGQMDVDGGLPRGCGGGYP